MILQKEIIERSKEWKVPPDTVDKDYVLGHFLSVFFETYKDDLIFKGGTCLRKCYIKNYRFSEDLDFTAREKDFVLEKEKLEGIAKTTTDRTGILFSVGEISRLVFNDEPKGFQVSIVISLKLEFYKKFRPVYFHHLNEYVYLFLQLVP